MLATTSTSTSLLKKKKKKRRLSPSESFFLFVFASSERVLRLKKLKQKKEGLTRFSAGRFFMFLLEQLDRKGDCCQKDNEGKKIEEKIFER